MTDFQKRMLASVLTCAFALGALSSCGGTDTEGADGAGAAVRTSSSTGVAVQTETVRIDTISSDSTVSGMITADDASTVMVALTAQVLDTYVKAGDRVEEGQLLCRLDLDSTLSNYRAACLSLDAARQSYADQSRVFDQQIEALNQQVSMAQRQVPIAEQQSSVAGQSVPLAEQQVPQAEQQAALVERQAGMAEQQAGMAEQQAGMAEQQAALSDQQIALAEQQIPQLQQQIGLLEQQLGTALTQQGMADKNVNDTRALYALGAASQAELDAAELQADQANLAVAQLRVQLDQSNFQIEQLEFQVSQAKLASDQAKFQADQAKFAVDQANFQADQADYQAGQARMAVDQAKYQVEQTKVQVAQSQLQPDQARLAVTQAQVQLSSAVAQKNSTLSQLEVSIENARANVQQMESALKNIDDEGNVVAPAAGVLVTFNATKNGYVGATAPVAVINETGSMEITAAVSESLVPKLHVGDKADVSIAALSRRFTAEIRKVDQTANSMTRLYNVTLTLPDDVTGLLSGMFADVTFHTDTVENTVVIPSEAILNDGDTQYVYVVDSNGKARYTEITTGMTGAGVTVVTDGLVPGQKLVTVGQSYLHDGDEVRIVGEDQAG